MRPAWMVFVSPTLLDQAPSRQPKEHALQPRLPMHGVLQVNVGFLNPPYEIVGLLGVDEEDLIAGSLHRVGGWFHQRDQFVENIRAGAELEDLRADVLFDEVLRGSSRDDATALHDDEAVAEAGGLLHVVGGKHERLALVRERPEPVPHEMPRLRVEARRGLVEHDDLRVIDEGPRDEEPALHPSGELLDPGVDLVRELHEVEERIGPLQNRLPGEIVVPAVDEQVFAHLQLVVEVVLLRNDTDAALYLSLVPVHVEACYRELAARRYDRAVDHLHRRGLPGPVGTKETETLPAGNLEVDAPYRLEPAVTLLEPARHKGRRSPGPAHGFTFRLRA